MPLCEVLHGHTRRAYLSCIADSCQWRLLCPQIVAPGTSDQMRPEAIHGRVRIDMSISLPILRSAGKPTAAGSTNSTDLAPDARDLTRSTRGRAIRHGPPGFGPTGTRTPERSTNSDFIRGDGEYFSMNKSQQMASPAGCINSTHARDRWTWVSKARSAAASSREHHRAGSRSGFYLALPHQLEKPAS